MEELDTTVDDQEETIRHHAMHSQENWLLHCALISAFLAVAAAVCGLYSSHYANEAMIEQIQASDSWSYYQAKGVKAMITELRAELMLANGDKVPAALPKKIELYRKEQDDIKAEATEKSTRSATLMGKHENLARAVTLFQTAIAIAAMAAICRRKPFLLLTLLFAAAGIAFMISGFSA